jgi:hypothetical protein
MRALHRAPLRMSRLLAFEYKIKMKINVTDKRFSLFARPLVLNYNEQVSSLFFKLSLAGDQTWDLLVYYCLFSLTGPLSYSDSLVLITQC